MNINLTINQLVNREQVKILRNVANVIVENIKYDPTEWDNLSIICIDDIEVEYSVKAIYDNTIIFKEYISHKPTRRLFSTVVGNVEHFDNYIIVK